MPQPKSISPGEGREALRQIIQIFRLQMWYSLTIHIRIIQIFWLQMWYGLTVHICIIQIFWLQTWYSLTVHIHLNLQQNFSFLSRTLAKFKKIKQNLLNSPTYSVNCAKFAPIINLFILCFRGLPRQRTLRNSSELRKFRAICPHSPRITRNSHHLLTYYTLCFRYLPRQRTLRNSSELRRFHAVHPHSPWTTRNSPNLLTYYILCFRCLTSGRELPKIPANQVKFAQFAHISYELREFRAFHSKLIHI